MKGADLSEIKNKVQYLALKELKKLPNNPRTIKRDDMERLKTSIKNNPEYFEARPLILSDRTGELVILAGNQRYEASKALGLDKVPCVVLSGLSEDKEREIIIRDNVSNGEWDIDILANEWDTAILADWGAPIKQFDDINFDNIESNTDRVTEKKPIKAVCPDCGREFEV